MYSYKYQGPYSSMMRIVLLLLTNFAVIVIFGIILNLIKIQPSSIIILMIIAGLFGFGGAFVSLLLSKSIALNVVRGKLIKQPNNEIENWLLNIVYRQAKQVNIAVPQVAIYQAYDINAFATGIRRDNALIAISTGLLQDMNHDEAEAVIAHEISHIANGDMVTMTLLQGVVNTFIIFTSRFLAQLLANFIPSNRNAEENSNGNLLAFHIVSTVLELLFGLLANIITLWFSRYREFYADAGSAELVGREKMIAALQKLQTSNEPQEDKTIISFCINSHCKTFSELFMSHPPLYKRIEALRSGIYCKKY